jgi:peptidoglycan/LPS O-acetylase OafA/YrhL
MSADDRSTGGAASPGHPDRALVATTDRIAFIDVMRTIAVLRVVVYHALLWQWLTWFEAMPVMFFVSGTLVGRSLASRSWRSVVSGRVRRLALPLVVYLGFALAAQLSGLMGSTTIHIWYVWTFLGFTLISPPLVWLMRRVPLPTLVVIVAAITAATLLGPGDSGVGAAYLLAWVAGLWWADRGCPFPPVGALVAVIVVGVTVSVVAVSALVGLSLQQSPSGVGMSMAGLGAAWLSLGLLLRHQLGALAGLPRVGPAIRFMSRRLLTIYLWHIPATIVARRVVETFDVTGGVLWVVLVLALTAGLTAAATVVFGPLEDRAAASSQRARRRAVGDG